MVKKRLSRSDQARIMIQLGEMMQNGFSITQALAFITTVFPDYKIKIQSLNSRLKKGERLSNALVELGISQNLLDQLALADAHGNLANSLVNLGKMLQYHYEQLKKIIQLLVYPFFLLIILGGLQLGLKMVGFEELTSNSNHSLNLFINRGVIIFSGLALFGLIFFIVLRRFNLTNQLKVISRIPMIGKTIHYYYYYLVMFDLTLFINNGFSINQMLEIGQNRPPRSYLYQISQQVKKEIISGKPLATIMQQHLYFPPELAQIITKGGENETLKVEFAALTKIIFQRLLTNIEKLINKIQPLMLIIVGVGVVIVYLNILLPVFEMMKGF